LAARVVKIAIKPPLYPTMLFQAGKDPMKRPRFMTLAIGLAALAAMAAGSLAAQPVDDTQLKQAIVFGRHSVRSPVAPTATLNTFSAQPVPDFGVSGPEF